MKITTETIFFQIYRISRICIGTPPNSFTFEYYDKNKAYRSVGPISPMEFYKKTVKPVFDMANKVRGTN